MSESKNEGWTWLLNASKWHYFRNGRSLCGKWMLPGGGSFPAAADDSDHNCAACKRKREVEKRKVGQKP